jgi:outer membrane protein TolC
MKRIVIFIAAALTTAGAFAETPSLPSNDANTLSVDAVVSEVLSNNPSLKAARANWEAMRERIPQVRAWDDPKLGFDSLADRFVHEPPNAMTDQRLMLEQALPLSGKNRFQGDAAASDALGAFEQFRGEVLDATAKARIAYFRLANAYAQLDVNRQNIDLLKQFADISRDKYKVGTHSESDVLTAETALAKAEEDTADIQRQIAEAQIELNRLMDRPSQAALDHPATLTFPPFDWSLEKIEGLALAHRPELFIAQKKIEAAQARLDAAHRQWIPDPTFRVEADRYNAAGQAVSEVNAGFSIGLPWFNRAKYKASVRENQKMLESAEYELKAARVDTLSLVENQFIEARTFHHHTELYKDKLLPLAEQTVSAKRLGYQSDKENFLELLTAQQNVQEMQSMYWDHLMHFQIALAELEASVGTSLAPAISAAEHQHHSE